MIIVTHSDGHRAIITRAALLRFYARFGKPAFKWELLK